MLFIKKRCHFLSDPRDDRTECEAHQDRHQTDLRTEHPRNHDHRKIKYHAHHAERYLFLRLHNQKREYYELEAINNSWTGRELERQINSMLYERLLLSNDKEAVLAVARKERIPESPMEIIKDPMVLEFLGLERQPAYYEKDLEKAIITHIADFLLELGKGFSFVARQKRILVEDDEYFADLIFYNRLLRCFVIVELKTGKLTHQDLGQLQMYVNYYDRYEKTPDENPTIGILLCTSKNDTAVRLALPENNQTILASQYQLYLPSQEQLIREVNEAKQHVYSASQRK